LLVCNWPHSVGQNHFVVKMLFKRDSTIQSTSRRFCADYKSKNSIPCQPSGRCVIPSGRPAVQSFNRPDDMSYRPNAHQTKASSVWTTWIPIWTFLCFENCSNLHPSGRFSSPFERLSVFDQASDFLSKIKYGKIGATVWTTWIPFRTRYSLR
jgi:hypothetical protein